MKRGLLLSTCCLLACTSAKDPSSSEAGTGIMTLGDPDSDDGGGDAAEGTGEGAQDEAGPDDEGGPGDGDGDADDGGTKFDLLAVPDGNESFGCLAANHIPCDANSSDPWHALGINCPGEDQFTTSFTGDAQQLYVHTGQLGTYNPPTYPPLEGEKMVILSSGVASEMITVGDEFASTPIDLFNPTPLPAPLKMNAVHATDTCTDNPNLIGTGDCSNTLQQQWNQGSGAYDYAELRLTGTVPQGASGFEYHLAFFSTEYPGYYKSGYNDMYVAWLESELWTGNISFDEMGNPISLNAGFLDYKDAPNPYDCPNCSAPELQGTVMETHAGTKWLTTTAGVNPGETITIVWAIWDLSDAVLDSVVILDGFGWNCEGGPPITIPG